MALFKIDRRLYRTLDGRLVEHGDLDAASLAYVPGQEIPEDLAIREGLAAASEPQTRSEVARAAAAGEPAKPATRRAKKGPT